MTKHSFDKSSTHFAHFAFRIDKLLSTATGKIEIICPTISDPRNQGKTIKIILPTMPHSIQRLGRHPFQQYATAKSPHSGYICQTLQNVPNWRGSFILVTALRPHLHKEQHIWLIRSPTSISSNRRIFSQYKSVAFVVIECLIFILRQNILPEKRQPHFSTLA